MGDPRDLRTLIARACLTGLFGGVLVGACTGTDANLEKQRLLDELNAAGTNKPAQCKPGIVEACYSGAEGTGGRGMCRGGNRTCDDNAQWGACTGEVLPKKETCNRADDDCDGITDNNFERDGASCTIGAGSCKTSGTWTCNADGLGTTCNAPPPKSEPERCDGQDNDCDNQVDEDVPGTGGVCQTGKPGVCAAGVMKCLGGTMQCAASRPPSQEICNGLDDDCNNAIDDRCLTTEEAAKLNKPAN